MKKISSVLVAVILMYTLSACGLLVAVEKQQGSDIGQQKDVVLDCTNEPFMEVHVFTTSGDFPGFSTLDATDEEYAMGGAYDSTGIETLKSGIFTAAELDSHLGQELYFRVQPSQKVDDELESLKKKGVSVEITAENCTVVTTPSSYWDTRLIRLDKPGTAKVTAKYTCGEKSYESAVTFTVTESEFYGTNPYRIIANSTHITDNGYLIHTQPYKGTIETSKSVRYKTGFLYNVAVDDAMKTTNLNTTMFDVIYDVNDFGGDRDAVYGFVTRDGVTYYAAGPVVAKLSDDLQSHSELFRIDEDLLIRGMCMVGDSFYIYALDPASDGKQYLMRYSAEGELIATVEGDTVGNLQYAGGYFYYKLVTKEGGTAIYRNDITLKNPTDVSGELFTSDEEYYIDNGMMGDKLFYVYGDMLYMVRGDLGTITAHKIGEEEESTIAEDVDTALFHNGKFYCVEYSGGNYRTYFLTECDTATAKSRSIGSYSNSSHVENAYDIDIAGDFVFLRQPGDYTCVHKISTGESSGFPILP